MDAMLEPPSGESDLGGVLKTLGEGVNTLSPIGV